MDWLHSENKWQFFGKTRIWFVEFIEYPDVHFDADTLARTFKISISLDNEKFVEIGRVKSLETAKQAVEILDSGIPV